MSEGGKTLRKGHLPGSREDTLPGGPPSSDCVSPGLLSLLRRGGCSSDDVAPCLSIQEFPFASFFLLLISLERQQKKGVQLLSGDTTSTQRPAPSAEPPPPPFSVPVWEGVFVISTVSTSSLCLS